MRLIERELGLEIELKENTVSILVVEKTALRPLLITELYSQIMNNQEGNWILIENEKNYELGKKAELILEPFTLELNNKKVKSKLYQEIKTVAQEFAYTQGLEVHAHICTYLENLLERIPYPVKYTEEWNLAELLKVYGVELEEESDNVYEKLFNYIKLINAVCGTEIFVAVNIKQYLGSEQIIELYKLAMYSKIKLVLIEFSTNNAKYDCEEIYIIDEDGCIITY